MCVQSGGNLANPKSEEAPWLSGAFSLMSVPAQGLQPQFCVNLALPHRTPRAWHTAYLLVVVLTCWLGQRVAGKPLLTHIQPLPLALLDGHKTANFLSSNPLPKRKT